MFSVSLLIMMDVNVCNMFNRTDSEYLLEMVPIVFLPHSTRAQGCVGSYDTGTPPSGEQQQCSIELLIIVKFRFPIIRNDTELSCSSDPSRHSPAAVCLLEEDGDTGRASK